MKKHGLIALTMALAVLLCGIAPTAWAAEKIKIEKLDDLPRHTYQVTIRAAEFLDNDAALMKLAGEVKKDLLDDLEKYDILDKTTLQGYYADLGQIAFLNGDYDTYLENLYKRRQLEDKEATRLTMGMVAEAYVKAKKVGGEFSPTFRAELKKMLSALPFATVEANVKQAKGSFEIMSKALTQGGLDAGVQPILDKSGGEISKDLATGLIGSGFSMRIMLPIKDDVVAVYSDYIKANEVKKADIWAARDVILTDKDGAAPVILAVWDSGVDAAIFKTQMWTNTKEIPENNKDDDNNGFVDDVNGIAWGLHSDKEISLLFPIGDVQTDRPRLQRRVKGLEDIQANIESPEATEVKQLLSSLPPDSVKPVFEEIGKYGNYSHGTHVAGIAAAGNPFARILATRITFDYHMIPETPTVELAEKEAKAVKETVEYFKKNGVRVVNMSWGGSLASVEGALEANNAGGTPEERKALARRIYTITYNGLKDAIAGAPDILFITSAGNADANVLFEEYYPSSLTLPNIMSIGAVDQAGDETNFTSFGKVDVYANGFEVESYVPGGDRMKYSGTSMSAPNVMNLAGKLLAKKPTLTPAQLRELIINGCDERTSGERKMKLINPKQSMELLAAMK